MFTPPFSGTACHLCSHEGSGSVRKTQHTQSKAEQQDWEEARGLILLHLKAKFPILLSEGKKILNPILPRPFFFFLDSCFQKILRSVWGWGKARVSRSNEFMKYFIVFYDDSHSISWWFIVFHVDPLLMIHNTNMGYNFKMSHCMENYLFNSASPKPIWALKRCTVKFQIILMWSPNTIWTKWQACTFYRYFSWSFPNLNRKNWSCLVEMPSCSRK